MTRRFYVAPGTLDGETLTLDEALARRLAKVLRLRAGDEILLFDGAGAEARVRLDAITDRGAGVTIIERGHGPAEPRVRVHLYQSVTKGERFEWLLEKATEIGVARFVPIVTARAVVKASAEGHRIDRWRRIVVEAAEQCERGAVPIVEAPQPFAEALASAPGLLLLPYEDARDTAPGIQALLTHEIDALFALAEVSIFIGPEGGYEQAEVQQAIDAGASVVTMGARVLRSETAGLVASTLVMHAVGELG